MEFLKNKISSQDEIKKYNAALVALALKAKDATPDFDKIAGYLKQGKSRIVISKPSSNNKSAREVILDLDLTKKTLCVAEVARSLILVSKYTPVGLNNK